MKLLKGKVVADQVKDTLKVEVEKLKANGKGVHLAIIQVGNDDASSVYVKNKIKACEYVGIDSTVIRLSSHISEETLLDTIRKLNEDEVIDGILVQLPLPAHINERKSCFIYNFSGKRCGWLPYNQCRQSSAGQ